MPHVVTYLEDDGIVLCEYSPPYPPSEFAVAIAENLAVASEHGTRLFLGDCRQMGVSGSLIDVYALGELIDQMVDDRHAREALVIQADPAARDTFDFFVTVTTNRGLVVRVFGEIEEAKAWLISEGERLKTLLDE